MKKILIFLTIFFSFFSVVNGANGDEIKNTGPSINCYGLPGCKMESETDLVTEVNDFEGGINMLGKTISALITYVGVFSVFSILISGFYFLISGGAEEKAKKAKKMIIWSVIGVFLSTSAWGVINLLNKFNFGDIDTIESSSDSQDSKDSK